MRLPRPQLHLSTCIVLMFVAAGLMWLNFREHNIPAAPIEQGWPLPCYFHFGKSHSYVNHGNFKIDLYSNFTILITTTVLCEWLARRRTKIKAERPQP